jgi:O-glycosyl hydrolase
LALRQNRNSINDSNFLYQLNLSSMKKRIGKRLVKIFLIGFQLCFFASISKAQTTASDSEDSIQIDGSEQFQKMDGFGVNVNTTWWLEGKYLSTDAVKPAIDLLCDGPGISIFRAVIEEIDWESSNDNDDPNNFNWNYYDSIFTTDRFQGVWNTLRYLNQKGITKGLILSFMGAPPASIPLAKSEPENSWMGDTTLAISSDKEDEFVESIAALLYYARYKAKIEFTLVSPINETDIISMTKSKEHPNGCVEGPNMPDAVQFIRVVKKLAEKLDAIGMSDIRFVAPDAGGDVLFGKCLDEMLRDSYLIDKLACWGVHDYGNDADNYRKIVSRSASSNKSFWITETAGISNIFGQLDDNPTAIIYWDGFDCVYQHGRRNGYGSLPPNDWVFWFGEKEGKPLIEYNATEQNWIPRKQFYEYAQLFRFLEPGATRISVTCKNEKLVVYSFLNPNKQVVIVGQNNSDKAILVNGKLSNVSKVNSFEMFYTDNLKNLFRDKDVSVAGNTFVVSIPAQCVFTLSCKAGDK